MNDSVLSPHRSVLLMLASARQQGNIGDPALEAGTDAVNLDGVDNRYVLAYGRVALRPFYRALEDEVQIVLSRPTRFPRIALRRLVFQLKLFERLPCTLRYGCGVADVAVGRRPVEGPPPLLLL